MIIEFCCTPSRLWQHKNNFFTCLFCLLSSHRTQVFCVLTSLGECQIRSLLCFFLTGIKCVQSILHCIKFNSHFFLYVFKCVSNNLFFFFAFTLSCSLALTVLRVSLTIFTTKIKVFTFVCFYFSKFTIKWCEIVYFCVFSQDYWVFFYERCDDVKVALLLI